LTVATPLSRSQLLKYELEIWIDLTKIETGADKPK